MDDETLERVGEAICKFNEAFMEQMNRVALAIHPLIESFIDICHNGYQQAGAPYGDNDEGMIRWLRERAEIARLKFEAERMEEHHRMMANFKKELEKRRNLGG